MSYPQSHSQSYELTYPQGRDIVGQPATTQQSRKQKLLTELACTVSLPDGTEGTCRYERLGPACHRFDFRYGDGAMLSRQYLTEPLGNTEVVIESKAREFTAAAFADAMEHERKDRFARVTKPTDGSRVKDPSRYCLDAKKAKGMGGKYALCLPVGSNGRLLRVSNACDTFAEVAQKWRTRSNKAVVIACCNRLDRCWQTPKYNPLPRESQGQGQSQEGVSGHAAGW